MPKRLSEDDRKIGEAVFAVVKEEADRQQRSLRSLSLAISPNAPNLLLEWRRTGRIPGLPSLFRLAKELEMPAHHIVREVERALS